MNKLWLNPVAVIQAACEVSGLDQDDLIGRDRTMHKSTPRKVLVHLLRKRSNLSYDGIGHILSGRDHTSILYLNKKALELPPDLIKIFEVKAEEIHRIAFQPEISL